MLIPKDNLKKEIKLINIKGLVHCKTTTGHSDFFLSMLDMKISSNPHCVFI